MRTPLNFGFEHDCRRRPAKVVVRCAASGTIKINDLIIAKKIFRRAECDNSEIHSAIHFIAIHFTGHIMCY